MSTGIAKMLHTWMIVDKYGTKRFVHEQPVRWDVNTGREPFAHEVQWDETVYSMNARILSPEEIDGPMVKVNDEAPEEWEKRPDECGICGHIARDHSELCSHMRHGPPMTMTRWIAQEIFRRIQRIVPRSSYGPGRSIKSSCTGSDVSFEINGVGAYRITVKETS